MPKLPVTTARDVLRLGFEVHRQTGSHVNLRHPDRPGLRVVIPFHSGDLAPKTLRSILSQSGINVEDFIAEL